MSSLRGDSGKEASVAALKFSGDVFTFVADAVKEKWLADVDIRGFTLSQNTYRDVPDKGGLLIGFQVGLGKFGDNDIIKRRKGEKGQKGQKRDQKPFWARKVLKWFPAPFLVKPLFGLPFSEIFDECHSLRQQERRIIPVLSCLPGHRIVPG